MAIDFPNSPSDGQTFSYANVNYVYNSTYTTWIVVPPDLYGYANSVSAGANNWANTKVASVTGTSGEIYSSGGTTPVLNLISTGVSSTTYGGDTQIPVVTIDAFGRVTSAANISFSAGGMDYAYVNTATEAANGYTNTVFGYSNTYTNSVGAASNGWANTVGTAANSYADTVGLASNNYANATFLKLTGGTINGDLNVSGNLTVTGNTHYINVDTYIVNDPLIYLAGNNYTSDIVDIGFVANYNNGSCTSVHTGLFRDAGNPNKEWYLFQGYDQEPENNVIDPTGNNFTIAILNATLRTSNVILNGSNLRVWLDSAYAQANAAPGISNSYAVTVGAASNGWTNTVFGYSNTYTNSVGAASNGWANTVVVGANAWTNTVFSYANTRMDTNITANAVSGNAWANTVVAGANAWANTIGVRGNAWTNTVFGYVNTNIAGANAWVNTSVAGANAWVNTSVAGANAWVNTSVAGANAWTNTVAQTQIQSTQTGTTYTLALTDAGKLVTLNNTSAITLTVPFGNNVNFILGTRIDIIQLGAGQVNVAPQGTGVSIFSRSSYTKLFDQYSAATLWKQGANTWYLIGDIA